MKYLFLIPFIFLISCSTGSLNREEIIIIEKKQPEEIKPTDEIITNKEQNNNEIIIQEIQKENEELIIVPEIAKAIETEKVDEKKADNITFGEIVKIGILLPLTGENKTLGRSISNALEMALFETKSKNIKLLFKDSGDSLEKATEAAQEAVKEGASMIIGPIFSYQASEIRKNISTNIPIFSFTNDESIKSDGLWALGFSPHQQIDAIFYEMSHHAVTDISIIVPTNIYGDIILQASRRASILRNIKINHIHRYDRRAKDFSEFGKLLNKEDTSEDNGLLIVASGKQLKEISSRAQYQGLSPKEIKYFGISGWNNEEILGEPSLLGGHFIAPQQFSYETFVSRYFKLYDMVPNEISGLAYDILALLSIGLKDSKNIQELLNFLVNPTGFNGIFGFFKISSSGDIQRKFISYEVMERNFLKKREIMP